MVQTSLNRVSVVSNALDRSVEFCREVFDFEPIPTPNFDFDGQLLEMADGRQLHLFDLETSVPHYHHFGVTVADFEAVYREGKERGALTDFSDERSYQLYSFPDGAVQMHVEDPEGNVTEVNWPDVSTLDQSIRDEITDRNDLIPQTGEAADATLHIDPPEERRR